MGLWIGFPRETSCGEHPQEFPLARSYYSGYYARIFIFVFSPGIESVADL
jgi:hypothetical protein